MQIDGHDIWMAKDEALEEYEKESVFPISHGDRHMIEHVLDLFIRKLTAKGQ